MRDVARSSRLEGLARRRVAPRLVTMLPTRTTLLHVSTLTIVRLLVTLAVVWLGFQGLSDDDFARVTLAQHFAVAPHLDPTGTSWLPFPFWLNGGLMIVLGRSLEVARAISIFLACASSLLLYATARSSAVPAHAAWIGVLAWTFVPVGVYAGASTVPEISTAALCASALLSLRRPDARAGLLAAACVLPASLSRYEAWPVAVVVIVTVALSAAPSFRKARGNAPGRSGSDLEPGKRLAAVLLAAAGPVSWVVWNGYDHGDPFSFFARVSAYWNAWGGDAHHTWTILLTYPKTAILDAPVLTASVLGAMFWTTRRKHIRSWLRPAIGSAATIAALMIAQASGGAPTHHPERTLLLVWAVLWIATADLLFGINGPQGRGWDRWRRLWLLSALGFMAIRTQSVSSWYGVHRDAELQLGRWLRDHRDGLVLLEPKDYGYFAVIAATGTPERVVLTSSVDPRVARAASVFDDPGRLRDAARDRGARWLVAQGRPARVAGQVGPEVARVGGWSVVEVR